MAEAGAEKAPIVFVLPGLQPGGAEHVVLAVAGELARRGMPCHIAAFGGGPLQARLPVGVGLSLIPSRKPWHGVWRLRRLLRTLRPRAVVSSVTNANLATVLATRWLANPPRVVLREANMTFEDSRSGSLAKRVSTLLGVRLLYPRADCLVALSAGMAADLQRAAGVDAGRVRVVPNPWIPKPVDEAAADADFRPRARQQLLACGRLERQKDYPTLLEALAQLGPECDAGLTIVGTGSLEAELRRLAQALGVDGRVDFRPYEANPARLMRRADAFVLSSRWEGFPNVLLEAICEGCPVVSTRSSDVVDELVPDATVGRVVAVGDVGGLAQALRDVLQRGRPAATHQSYRERYHLERIADIYAGIIATPA
jgi:glycosyltransferase involved in cell wall biosynthesis